MKKPRKFVDFLKIKRIISSCMDTNNYGKIPKCGSCPDLTGFRVVVGAKQLKKALNKGVVQQVFLAKNADPAITEQLELQCRQMNVPAVWVASMADLGRACGIEVGAAAAAAVD